MNKHNNERAQRDERAVYTDALLPALTQEEIAGATHHKSKFWILGLMGEHNIGKFEWFSTLGIALQTVGPNTLRCLSLYNDGAALANLAMIRLTAEAVGGDVQAEGYTIMQDYNPVEDYRVEDNHQPEISGMEVA